MSTELVLPENLKEIEKERKSLIDEAESMQITDEDTYDHALWFRQEALKALSEKIHAVFDPVCEAAHQAHKRATTARKQQLAPIEAAYGIVNRKINDWKAEQDRQRREREEKLRAERMKQIEEMRRREEDIKLEQAQAAEAAGNEKEAEEILSMPSMVPDSVGPVQVRDATKREGIQYREYWNYEVINPDVVPNEYKIVDHKKLGAVVRATKGNVSIPGVRIWSEKRVVG